MSGRSARGKRNVRVSATPIGGWAKTAASHWVAAALVTALRGSVPTHTSSSWVTGGRSTALSMPGTEPVGSGGISLIVAGPAQWPVPGAPHSALTAAESSVTPVRRSGVGSRCG